MHSPDPLSEAIIGAAFQVSNTLGAGFLEKVYENALSLELLHSGLTVLQQYPIRVRYRGTVVGEYLADLLVEGCALVEVKALRGLEEVHLAQCINYLKAADLRTCLLLNFGRPRLEIRRVSLGCPQGIDGKSLVVR